MKKLFVDLFYKITSRKLWVWIVTTLIAYRVLKHNGDHDWIVPVVVVWGVVSFCYFAGDAIVDAVSKAIENAQIKIGK